MKTWNVYSLHQTRLASVAHSRYLLVFGDCNAVFDGDQANCKIFASFLNSSLSCPKEQTEGEEVLWFALGISNQFAVLMGPIICGIPLKGKCLMHFISLLETA